MKILTVSALILLLMAAVLPLRASASASAAAPRSLPVALAVGAPLHGLISGHPIRFVAAEPGMLLVVGSALMGLGTWLRSATAARDEMDRE